MDPLEAELQEAQQAYKDGVAQLADRRRRAVVAAKDAGWPKYRIAQRLGVHPNTVEAILKTADKNEERS